MPTGFLQSIDISGWPWRLSTFDLPSRVPEWIELHPPSPPTRTGSSILDSWHHMHASLWICLDSNHTHTHLLLAHLSGQNNNVYFLFRLRCLSLPSFLVFVALFDRLYPWAHLPHPRPTRDSWNSTHSLRRLGLALNFGTSRYPITPSVYPISGNT